MRLGRLLVVLIVFALSFPAEAQQLKKVPRIGFLAAQSPVVSDPRYEVFRKRLTELGYTEGKNIVIEYRYAEGKLERLPDLAADLVRLKVDVIVASGLPAAYAAKQVTTTIPIVMSGGDPVATGVVASLAHRAGMSRGCRTLLSV